MSDLKLLWEPSAETIANARITHFISFLREEKGLHFSDYPALHRWSVNDLEGFWESVWKYFDIQSDAPYKQVIAGSHMPGARWFEGSKVNYAEHILRGEQSGDPTRPAIVAYSETRPSVTLSWGDLCARVLRLATSLRQLGIGKGDPVVSYMPNIPETVIAMLATISIGAVWASAATEFGTSAVIDRFAQMRPKVLFAVDGYRFNGKDYDRTTHVERIIAELPSLETVVWLPYLRSDAEAPSKLSVPYADLLAGPAIDRQSFKFERVDIDSPLWVLFSSGTTGLPKAIVHGHAGMIATHYVSALHSNFHEASRIFYYTTTGWMVFNVLVSALMTGASIVTYDGSPTYPEPDVLFDIVAKSKATGFAASPTFIQGQRKLATKPGVKHDLSSVNYMMVTGSPAQPEDFEWVYDAVKKDVWMSAPCGGTEICSAIVGSIPTLPVYAGEISAPILGIDARAFDPQGNTIVDEIGELVLAAPAPCMPLHFLNDPDGRKYFDSYFNVFPGVWRHGDFVKFDKKGASVVYGRSDSTLNRHGVRIGTAEIYRCIEALPEIADSIVVCNKDKEGRDYMSLFVVLNSGFARSDGLVSKIANTLRTNCSPRHVPDSIRVVAGIPYTLTGKKMEIPVRKILEGASLATTANPDSMKDPSALDDFLRFAQESQLAP
ncbi:acetoacetate--CoA ligase [Bradyrhizobium sp.]|uniref:acetoacetate--CoA ligase n=1 Tax=Bradyrhizobium sp. TaxID=376 RepID=UPI001D809EA1|nr:acetoacetate--CoA ligase [Bradyrhizobium sp.]MBI5317913.1 acetoacetate--CoA ligase [Bradyrhizobium sp.]